MDKTIELRVRAKIEPEVTGRVQIQPEELFDIPRNSGQGGTGRSIPRPDPLPKFNSYFEQIRRDSEEKMRLWISEANRYTTSGRESEKYIKEKLSRQSLADELLFNQRMSETSQKLKEGRITPEEASQRVTSIREQYNENRIHTRILKDILETLKSTSKDEIRENAKNVQENLRTSKLVGQLGASGDEYQILKERFQKEELSDEQTLRKFNISRYANVAMSAGGALGGGDLGALAAMGGRGLLSSLGGVGLAGGVALGAGATVLGTIAAAFASNKDIAEKSRSYMVASQRGMGSVFGDLERYNEMGFYNLGMKPFEGMSFNADLRRASGGRSFDPYQMLGYAGLTKSREVSPELLNSIISNQRYSSSGDAITVATTLERTLEKIYPKEFKDKLIQLPEMMGVYNSLAQQMIQTTGRIDSNQLAGFVGGIREGFGVEGVNLQRYAGGMMNAFRGSQNPYVRKMQFAALRQSNPNIGYHEALAILENPTSDQNYMRNFAGLMQKQGLTQFKGWLRPMGFGEQEMQNIFESGNFSKVFDKWGKINQDKTSPKEDYEKFYKAGQDFYAASEKQMEEISSFFREFKKDLGEIYEKATTDGVAEGFKKFNAQGGVISVKDVNKFR